MNISYSAVMMTNYLPAELITPQKKFEAIQTNDGHALLFSISTNGSFCLTLEQSGKSTTGWSTINLGLSGHTCSTFGVGQSAKDGTIGLAMTVTTSDGDDLYLCLGNSNSNITWADSPVWRCFEYDDPTSQTLSKPEIVNVFFCETSDSQYIIVDIVRNPKSEVKEISRYYIDPKKASGHYWNSHSLPADFDTKIDSFGSCPYDSCLGRAINGTVDGLYTAGRSGNSGQLIFQPVINVYGDAPPTVVTLALTERTGEAYPIASAVASTRNSNLSTDLFAVSGDTIYYFSSTNQLAKSTADRLITNDLINNTSKLFAMAHNGVITLWGRNSSDQVYYTSCEEANVSVPSAWSIPVPILSGIEEISPYINRADGGNTIFASGEGKLQRITQATTSSSKIWQTNQVTLPAPPMSKSISFNSYTTTILVLDEQNLPLNNAILNLSANNRSSVYINGLYYVLDTTPIKINTNSLGTITIIEPTDTLIGTIFNISADTGITLTINPMDMPFKKFAKLGSSNGNFDNLSNATIKEGDGTIDNEFKDRNLVSSNTNNDLKKAVAIALSDLDQCYDFIDSTQPLSLSFETVQVLGTLTEIYDDILISAGDLFRWLESRVEAVIKIIRDDTNSVFYFIAKIAEKTYRAILNTVESVVGALQWVFDAIKTDIEDIIKYIAHLFDWGDITRTKDVLSNMISLFLADQLNSIPQLKDQLDESINSLEYNDISWDTIINDVVVPPTGDPLKGQTPASQHLSYHYQVNVSQISFKDELISSISSECIQSLLKVLQTDQTNINAFFDNLKKVCHDWLSNPPSLECAMTDLANTMTKDVLNISKSIMDSLLEFFEDMGNDLLNVLGAKIHIPVISDILNDIHVSDITFLDLFCWIGGVSYTEVHKIANNGKAPFPEDDETINQLTSIFKPSVYATTLAAIDVPNVRPETEVSIKTLDSTSNLSPETQLAVFGIGHRVGGLITAISSIPISLAVVDANPQSPYVLPSTISGIMSSLLVGAADYLVPKKPIKENSVNLVRDITLIVRLCSMCIFSNLLLKKFFDEDKVNDVRALGSIVDVLLIIPAFFCTSYHFYELAAEPTSNERTDGILEEVSNYYTYMARLAYCLAVNAKDPDSKGAAVGGLYIANTFYSILQISESEIN